MDMPFILFGLDRGFEFGARYGAVGDFSLAEQEIDNLVLIERRAKLGRRHRIRLHIFDETLPVLGIILLGGLLDQPAHFGARNLDLVLAPDFGEQQPEADPPHGNATIIVLFGFHFLESRFGVGLVACLMLKLLPDLVEFGFDHRWRHLEIVRRGKLVEQAALHVRTGQPVQFLLDLALEQPAKLLKTFKAQGLREFVVGLDFLRNADIVDDQVEGRFLALQIIDRVILGKSNGDRLFLVGRNTDHAFLEPRDHATRAEFDRGTFTLAAIELHTVDLPDEIDHDKIAKRRLVSLRRIVIGLLLAGKAKNSFVDRRLVGLDRQSLELEAINLRRGHVGQDFELDLQFGILAMCIALDQLDRRRHCGAQLLLGDERLDAFLDRAVERVGLERFAVHLADKIGGNLPGAEARHAHLRRDLANLALDPGFDVLGLDGQRVAALQAFVQRLDNLHGPPINP